MLDLRRLRLLHEFRLRGTISAVATALSYSPSSVSQQLSVLEQEAGVTLFTRAGRKLHLTERGLRLAMRAQELLDLQDEVFDELSSSPSELVGFARVSVIQSAALTIVPDSLEMLALAHPRLRIELFQVPPEIALFELAGRRFDLVIAEQYPGMSRPRRADFDVSVLGSDPMSVVVPVDSPAESLRDLADATWVMEPPGTAARAWAVQQCRAAGFEPEIRFEGEDLTAHLRLIERGLACGILPGLFLAANPLDGVKLLAMTADPQRTVFTTTRATSAHSPAIQACRGALTSAFALRMGSERDSGATTA